MTVETLLNEFHLSYVRKRLKPNTQRGYLVNIRNHLVPFMGQTDLSDLSWSLLDEFCAYMEDKGLKSTTTVYALAVLRRALRFALRRDYVDRNIFDAFDLPRKAPYEYTTFGPKECQTLLSYLSEQDDDALLPIFLAVRHGLRRGECLGVKSTDIDREQGVLQIRRSLTFSGGGYQPSNCKNRSSLRNILLDDTDFLWIDRYCQSRPEHENKFLCRNHDGVLISSNVLQKHFVRALAACDLPRIRFHDLRHTFATHMMGSGVNPRLVSDVLGHSDVKTTMAIYQHGTLTMQKGINDRTHDLVPDITKKQD